MNIVNNPFVSRHTAESPFSYYTGDIADIPAMVVENFNNNKEGYRQGVILVSVPADGFISGVATLSEGDALTGSFKARRKGEDPRMQVLAKGAKKMVAASVDIVLYRSDVLAETGDNTLEPTEANWEVISINASPTEGAMPINPNVLMHNHFGSTGGTDTKMTDEEFVRLLKEGFEFWKNKAMCG